MVHKLDKVSGGEFQSSLTKITKKKVSDSVSSGSISHLLHVFYLND